MMYQAPELLLLEEDEGSPSVRRNKQTDVYALGMVCLYNRPIAGSITEIAVLDDACMPYFPLSLRLSECLT